MVRKITYELVKKEFESEGFILLSNEYTNNHQLLNFICPNGHKHKIRFKNWCNGGRCSYCSGIGKLSYTFVKDSFEKEGYKLLSTKYVKANGKLMYECVKGHRRYISWNKWRGGRRCPYCSENSRVLNRDIDYIRKEFFDEGYILLTNSYINVKSKLKYICKYGHTNEVSWNKWQQGRRCPTCKGIKLSIERSGENNPQWKGGISKLPYCPNWTKEYKEEIKERDGHICLNPYCFGNYNRLHVHHVDYTKTLCGPNNLVTVCGSCNSRANKDREWHTQWYRTILNRRYGYEY